MPSQIIRVRFATNRDHVGGNNVFGNGFGQGGPTKYVTGSVDVARISSLPDTGWNPLLDTLVIDPPTPAEVKVAPTPSPSLTGATGVVEFAKDRIAASKSQENPGYGLVLIHGFASTFIDALRRAGQVAHAYRAADIFCFSWPANGIVDIPNYKQDRIDAEKSAAALADALAHLFLKVGQEKYSKPILYLVSHSMGNYALRGAVQQIRKTHPELLEQRVFEGAFLMAADEDLDALSIEAKLVPLLTLAKRVSVYHAGGDLALGISQTLNGPRLGHLGPLDLSALPVSVTSIDCSDVARTQGDQGQSHFSHQYYRLSQRVIGDVLQVLSGAEPGSIAGRLRDPAHPESGRAFWLPFDPQAGAVAVAAVARTNENG